MTKVVAFSLTAVALLGIVLSLLGFGMAVAASTTFGIPYSTMLQSPFDALVLSTTVITVGIVRWFAFDGEIYLLLAQALPSAVGAIFLLSLAPIAIWVLVRGGSQARRPAWIKRLVEKPRPTSDSFGLTVSRALSFAVAWTLALPFTTFGLLLSLGLACYVLAIIPVIGLDVGRSYLNTYVIAAEACVPVRDRAAHLVRAEEDKSLRRRGEKRKFLPGATCVRIRRSDGESIAGRVALSTSNAVLLYDPASGVASRIPLDDAVIESIDELAVTSDARSDS